MSRSNDYKKAKRRAGAKMSFYIHSSVYITVCLLLAAINLVTTPDYFWFLWAVMGWGIGIVFHALGVFLFSGGSDLPSHLVEDEMNKIQSRRAKRES
ncbi:MAG: hypothetical protein COA42_15705 [Alteromonadaceae bacterium]|nr:MAG: hypothetical protein COA42_15705 [Alteromonadaceae bacterium]